MNNHRENSLLGSDIFSHLVSMKYIPRWSVLFLDLIICTLSYFTAYYLSGQLLDNAVTSNTFNFIQSAWIILVCQIFFFWVFHTYSGVLRYSGYVDAAKLLFAVSCNMLLLIVLNFVSGYIYNHLLFPYVTLVFYSLLSYVVLFGVRLTVKIIYDLYIQNTDQVIPVMIFGTNSADIGIAKLLLLDGSTRYKLVGFIDNQSNATQKMILGVKVYMFEKKNIETVIKHKAKAIIVSPGKMKQIDPNSDLDLFINNNMAIYTFPEMSLWNNDLPSIKQMKSIQIEDLLERPQIEISKENIAKQLDSKVILITGAAGSIGSEIVRQVVAFSPQLIVLLDQAETPMHNLRLELEERYPDQNFNSFVGDIRNKERMDYLIEMFRPDVIYHAAAYKHVPLMEENPAESILANVKGTKTIADLAVKYNVDRFVMISTDKAVNPTNVMGASKRIAEIYVQSLFRKLQKEGGNTKFITTRFGNVLGSNGSVIPHFKNQIEKGGPVTVTHPEIIRYFMTIPEACILVLEAGAMGNGGEIFIFDMGSPVKIVNLARKMIRLAGYIPDKDIKIEYTGLRPGEKLYEELLNQKEITTKTHHPKIMIAKVREYDYEDVNTNIEELIKYSTLCKNFLIVSLMKKIVPEFISKNSPYERLDV